jgi:Protein of unknown function (DUF1579)
MKCILIAALALGFASSAFAADAPAAAPAGAPAGAPDFSAQLKGMQDALKSAVTETKKLQPLVGSFTMTGKTSANSMGPGSPEATTRGKGTCKWVQGGQWLSCEWEENYTAGKNTWKFGGNYLMGYDPMQKGFRMVSAEGMGASLMVGTLDGSKITFDMPDGSTMDMGGHKMAMRIGWDFTDAKAVKFDLWSQVDGGAWTVSEESIGKKAGGGS